MKSDHLCPACQQPMEWIEAQAPGCKRLFCGETTCRNRICGDGVIVDTRMGMDVNDAMAALTNTFERKK